MSKSACSDSAPGPRSIRWFWPFRPCRLPLAAGMTIAAACGGEGESIAAPAEVATVTISPAALMLVPNQHQALTATSRDAQGRVLTGRAITWQTSQPSVVAISVAGSAMGVGAGSAVITAAAEGRSASVAVTVVETLAFVSFAAGGAHTCALTLSGAAFCWGRGEVGQLGGQPPSTCDINTEAWQCSESPIGVQGAVGFVKLVAGGTHTCGLTGDGTAYCWGDNGRGQLGNGLGLHAVVPVPVSGGMRFATIDAGHAHTCGITIGGAAYCWGSNLNGEVGDGTFTRRFEPVSITGGHVFRDVMAGGYTWGRTCGLTTAGAAYCWGDSRFGGLGIGATSIVLHPTPQPVVGGLTWAGLTGGLGDHVCGLTTAGSAHCWGQNEYGALGNGSRINADAPSPLSGGVTFTSLTTGGFLGHSCGLTGAGVAYCWGDNERGQVGDGSTVDREVATAVAGGHVFSRLDAGWRHTCGLATTGTLYCWGSGQAAQLGTGSTTHRLVPTRVARQP